ncbi:MAG: hypothetical protein ACU833_14960 [Gammaproteobacteria bacterium]
MRAAYVFLLILTVSGCASTSGNRLPVEAQNESKLYYVQRQPNDGRNLHRLIAEALGERGFNTLAGEAEDRPPDIDYTVIYVDRWRWDMRMYLLDLRIEIHEADTGKIIGYGQSYQPSLSAMGMSFRDVIDRALNALLQGR